MSIISKKQLGHFCIHLLTYDGDGMCYEFFYNIFTLSNELQGQESFEMYKRNNM